MAGILSGLHRLDGKHLADFIQDVVDLFWQVRLDEPGTEGLKIRNASEIIGIVSAHLKNAKTISLPTNGEVKMFTADANSFGHIR